MANKSVPVLLLATSLLVGCNSSPKPVPPKPKPLPVKPMEKENKAPVAAELNTTGEIVYKALEGGFYAFYADNGKHYMPMNLEEEYKRSGLRVRIRAKLQPTVRTIYMHGTPIEILEIEIIGRSPTPKDDRI